MLNQRESSLRVKFLKLASTRRNEFEEQDGSSQMVKIFLNLLFRVSVSEVGEIYQLLMKSGQMSFIYSLMLTKVLMVLPFTCT